MNSSEPAPRSNTCTDAGCSSATRCSPGTNTSGKTINEYCLLSPGGEAEALASVKYAEALRGCMVQLYKNDMRVNLPAPLHLAEQVEEYIWDWELTGRR